MTMSFGPKMTQTDKYVCSKCRYTTHSFRALQVHERRNKGHFSANWELGHLIIRGDPKDEPRRRELRRMIEEAKP